MRKQVLLILFLTISTISSAQLLLNEAYFDVSASLAGDANGDGVRDNLFDDEFLEFLNISNAKLDISGYKIYDKDRYDRLLADSSDDVPRHIVPKSTILSGKGVFVVFGGGDVSAIDNMPNVIAQTASSGTLSLQNLRDAVYVTDASGKLLFTFDPGELGLNSNGNQSLSLPLIGTYRGHQEINGKKFSPGIIDASITNNLVLNEIFASPGRTTGDANNDGKISVSDDQFIELVNNTGAAIDMTGYRIYDFKRFQSGVANHVVPAGTILEDGGVFVLFGGGEPTGDFGGAIVQTCSHPKLKLYINRRSKDPAEVIVITNPNDEVVSIFNSLDFGFNLSDKKVQFISLTRYPPVTGNYKKHTDTFSGGRFSPGKK